MAENWLQRTMNTSDVIDDLLCYYGQEKIDEITSTEAYKDAQAALALAMSAGLDKTKLSRGKRKGAGIAMMDDLMTGTAVVFMLGYQARENEERNAK